MEINEMQREKFESDTLTKIIPALLKAQKEMENINKDGEVNIQGRAPRKYATLGGILNVIKKSLINNDIAFTQPLQFVEGNLFLYTNLRHISGEFINTRTIMFKHENDQEFGKSVTYSRRYAALCALGCAPDELEDDDGESQKNNQQQDRPQYTSTSSDKISEAQLKMFLGRTQKTPELVAALAKKYNVEFTTDFKKKDFNNILIEIDSYKK